MNQAIFSFLQDDWALDEKYAKLTVLEDDYFHNSVRFHKFTFDENLDKLEKPVNRTKWSMTPPQVIHHSSLTHSFVHK